MPATFEVYNQDGDLVLDINSKILHVTEYRSTPTYPSGFYNQKYYYSALEEASKLILIRPKVIGNSLEVTVPYSNTSPYMMLDAFTPAGVKVNGSTGNAVEVCISKLAQPTTKPGYLDAYDEQGNLMWSLNSFLNGVRVLGTFEIPNMPLNKQEYEIPLNLSGHNLNNVFLVPQYEVMVNKDSGSNPDYFSYGFRFRIANNKVYFKYIGYGSVTRVGPTLISIALVNR